MNISLLREYFKSSDINYNLYAIYIIKTFIEKNMTNNIEILIAFKNQLTKEDLILLSSLLNKNDNKLTYNVVFTLVNISYLENGEKLFSLDDQICCNIASFLGNNRNEKDFLFYGLLLLKNICMDKNVCDIFNRYNIAEFFGEIYEKYLLDNKLMGYLMAIISYIIYHLYNAFFEKSKVNISILIPLIKIIATQIRINYPPNLLYKYIYKIYQLCSFVDTDIHYEIINCKLHKELISIFPTIEEKVALLNQKLKEFLSLPKEEITKHQDEVTKYKDDLEYYDNSLLAILKIFGKLMYLDDGIITQNLLNAGISSFLTKVLQSNDIRIIKNACFCISNICAGTYGQSSYLFNDNTLYELIKVSKNILEAIELRQEKDDYYLQLLDVFREINFVFSITISNTLIEKVIPFCQCENYTVIIILMKGLNILLGDKNQDLFSSMFIAINKLILFTKDYDNNIFFNMEKYGLKENLEKIIITGSLALAKEAEKIHESLYGLI